MTIPLEPFITSSAPYAIPSQKMSNFLPQSYENSYSLWYSRWMLSQDTMSGKVILSFFSSGFTFPAGRLYRFQETGQQFFLCGLTETFSAEVFDDRVHVSLVDRTEPHAHGLLVDYRNGDIYIVGPVEIGNDATRKIRVGIAVVVRKLVDEVKRLEFVVGIVILPAVCC